MTNKVDLLLEVRDLIHEPEHWTKHEEVMGTVPEDMRYCLLGAIKYVSASHGLQAHANSAAVLGLGQAIDDTLHNRGCNIPGLYGYVGYNDRPSTMHSDVIDLLDDTIRRLKGE